MSFHKTNNWLLAEPSGGITETSDKKKEKGKKEIIIRKKDNVTLDVPDRL